MTADSGRVLTPTEIADAFDRGDVEVVYQPCYDLRTGVLVSVEALSRLRMPGTDELIPPERFLPVAEEAGLVGRLDDIVLRTATAQVARWRAVPGAEGLCLAINLSVVGLDDAGVPARFRERAEEAGLPTDAIIVEITETVLSRAGRGHEGVVAGLAEVGCNVTLDDFGTGNASFEYLQRFRVGGIKIDRSFVQFLGAGGRGERLAESLLRFCLSLGVLVVAEGVEHPRQLAALRRLGCPFVQGFLLGAPMSTADISRLVSGEVALPLSGPSVQYDAGVADASRSETAPPLPAGAAPHPAPHAAATSRSLGRQRLRTAEGRGVTFLLAGLLLVLLVGLPGYLLAVDRANTHELLRVAQERLESVDTLAAERIDKEIDGLARALTAYSRSAAVHQALTGDDPVGRADAVATIADLAPNIHTSSLYDARGRMLAVRPPAPRLIGDTFAFRDYFKGAVITQGAYVSEAFRIALRPSSWTIAVAAAVRDQRGEVIGVVVATLSLERMQEDLSELLSHHGSAVTLTDSRGRILAAQAGGVGTPVTDPRLMSGRSSDQEDPTAPDADLWAVRPVPALGGWLLAEQTQDQALGGHGDDLGTGQRTEWAIALLVLPGLALMLLWLTTDRRRRRLAAAVQSAHEQVEAVLEATPAPLVLADVDERIVLANPAFAALVGVQADDLVGQQLSGWLPDRLATRAAADDLITSVVTTRGDARTVEVYTQTIAGESGPLRLYTLADVTPHRRERDRLQAQGRRDPLTGAGNRVALHEALGAAVRHVTAVHAVVMFDLDGFKAVNDELGHAVGDQVLCLVADTLAAAMGPNDLVARPGGDEFVVLLRLDRAEQGEAMAAQLRGQLLAALADHPALRGRMVGVSAGVAAVGVDGEDPETLLQVADRRMYGAKRRGR